MFAPCVRKGPKFESIFAQVYTEGSVLYFEPTNLTRLLWRRGKQRRRPRLRIWKITNPWRRIARVISIAVINPNSDAYACSYRAATEGSSTRTNHDATTATCDRPESRYDKGTSCGADGPARNRAKHRPCSRATASPD